MRRFAVLTTIAFATALVAVLAVSAANSRAQTPTPDALQTSAVPQPATFPADARIGFIDADVVLSKSKFGQTSQAQMKELAGKLDAQIAARAKEIKDLQDRIQQQQAMVSEAIHRGWLKDLDRLTREAEFLQEDRNLQVEQLNRELVQAFEAKALPLVEAIRNQRGLWAVFTVGQGSNVVAWHRGLDLSGEIIQRMDGSAVGVAADPQPIGSR